jgi:hypothetical protein
VGHILLVDTCAYGFVLGCMLPVQVAVTRKQQPTCMRLGRVACMQHHSTLHRRLACAWCLKEELCPAASEPHHACMTAAGTAALFGRTMCHCIMCHTLLTNACLACCSCSPCCRPT